MDKKNCYCVILAGGAGTRFWPLSTAGKPKQFMKLNGYKKTLLQITYERYLHLVPENNIIVVTAQKYRHFIEEQLPDISPENVLYEPYTRNTAPSVAYATYTLLKRNPDAVMLVTPSDHLLHNDSEFQDIVDYSFEYADNNGVLLALGIVPTRPDTNYGYIQAVGGHKEFVKHQPKKVKTFTEKPDRDLAKVFVKSGEFYWNSGVFSVKAEILKDELQKHIPEIARLFANWENALGSAIESDFIARAYTDCPNISIGFGVMEKTDKSWICPVTFGWNDIGTWEALYEFIDHKDLHGNVVNVERSIVNESKDNLLISTKTDKLIAVRGLEDYMVIDTDDVLVICPKDDKKFKEFTSEIAMPPFEQYR